MDLGFGGFLEKFENHFGGGWTKALLILIALTVSILCGSVIWTYLLLPFAQLLPDPKSGPAYEFAKLVVISAFFLMIVNQILSTFDNYQRRRIRRQLRGRLEEARELLERAEARFDEAKQLHDEAMELHRQTDDGLAVANLLIEQMFAAALEKGLMTQEQADELRALQEKPTIGAPDA